MFLVTGVTGNIGSEVARALLASGQPVRGVIRTGTDIGTLPAGMEPVVGDLNDADSLLPALSGVDGVFLLPGYDGAAEFLAAAAHSGVHRLVQLSGGSAGSRDMSNAVTAYMAKAEDIATASGLAWTILRPSAFMSNALRWLPQLEAGDDITAPFATVRTAAIDPADIGAVAAAALTTDGHAKQIYRLSGPEAMVPAEQVAILAEVLDRPLRFIGQSDAEAYADMSSQMPAAYVDAFFDFYVKGSLDESAVLPTVPDIIGRPANSFVAWARAHAAEFGA